MLFFTQDDELMIDKKYKIFPKSLLHVINFDGECKKRSGIEWLR